MNKKTDISGAVAITAFVKTLPTTPGVYQMRGVKGKALYIGKARNLKKRVTAYTKPEKHSIRIQRMIASTTTMEFTTTHTEAEALLLEANLIKKEKPKYNILLRDDKSFPYIHVTGHDFPQVTKHRGAREGTGRYFGPFASGKAVNQTLAVLQKVFQLRNCSDNVFNLRTRPCLQYQIKRCTAPCVDNVTKKEYAEQVKMAQDFLNGKSRKIQERFTKKMQDASDKQDYETAAGFRDRIRALTYIQSQHATSTQGIKDADVFGLAQKNGRTCIQVFFFRGGQNLGNRGYDPRHEKDETPGGILSAFITQFYTNKPVPKTILLSHDTSDKKIIAEALSIKSPYKVILSCPQRGNKKSVVDGAVENAERTLAHRLAAHAEHEKMFERLAEAFDLDSTPDRIEVYDNSHIAGTDSIGAMIVAGTEGFQKNAYRKYNIKTARGDDDYGMMREMLTRRFKKMADSATLPDLILIDGGKGQLGIVLQVMADMGVSDIPVVAIAKGADRNAGRETFYRAGRQPFTLPPGDPALYYLQRLRDEAHRFAIMTHRNKRRKHISSNPLDQIDGIGAKRKKALLLHFGSAKAVAEAGVADLQRVSGISKAAAERIYRFFHEE